MLIIRLHQLVIQKTHFNAVDVRQHFDIVVAETRDSSVQ